MPEEVTSTSRTARDQSAPQAMIHKQILEEAESRSDASMAELAEAVSGATVDLVERVLEQYGDPAGPNPDSDGGDVPEPEMANQISPNENGGAPVADLDSQQAQEGDVDRAELTEKQLSTLRAIKENPDATQAELADLLGVSTATINTRVNSIDSFDWTDRKQFVQVMFDENDSKDPRNEVDSLPRLSERVDELAEQVKQLEQQFAEQEPRTQFLIEKPELAHKVIHACFESELIAEEEELELLKSIVGR